MSTHVYVYMQHLFLHENLSSRHACPPHTTPLPFFLIDDPFVGS